MLSRFGDSRFQCIFAMKCAKKSWGAEVVWWWGDGRVHCIFAVKYSKIYTKRLRPKSVIKMGWVAFSMHICNEMCEKSWAPEVVSRWGEQRFQCIFAVKGAKKRLSPKKVVCERWCVTKLCVKDGVWQGCIWKMVLTKLCVTNLCGERWCVTRWGRTGWRGGRREVQI